MIGLLTKESEVFVHLIWIFTSNKRNNQESIKEKVSQFLLFLLFVAIKISFKETYSIFCEQGKLHW